MESKEICRKLFDNEIEFILDYIQINKLIPYEISNQKVNNIKNQKRNQLKFISIYPSLIPKLKEELKRQYFQSLLCAGEQLGVEAGQVMGEQSTQATLNTFHQAGSSKKIATSSNDFKEIINATTNPKNQICHIHFVNNNSSIAELRKLISNNLVELTLAKLEMTYEIHINKEKESWYDAFYKLYECENPYTNCISVKLNMNLVYEYDLTLEKIGKKIQSLYENELFIIHSPSCFGQIDIFCDTNNIIIPKKLQHLITKEIELEMFLEDVVYKELKNTLLFGIKGIKNIQYRKSEKGKWMIETMGNNFKQILLLSGIDFENTITSNINDIYNILGIEAVRHYMIDILKDIMEGINKCHIRLLVDNMTHKGNIAAVTRHTTINDDAESGPLAGATFEQSTTVFANAVKHGTKEMCQSVASSIIMAFKANIGTNHEVELYYDDAI